ncbi:hypothetical protein [Aquimarina muelleri]|nr:hypothetical protein [Aquimarina muelleri]MCX2761216.1 hypothetical protein [Aquimarina muelleri]
MKKYATLSLLLYFNPCYDNESLDTNNNEVVIPNPDQNSTFLYFFL